MMAGVLLDTHAAVWWRSRVLLRPAARNLISEARTSGSLHLCAISAWELVFALQKSNPLHRPDLGGLTPLAWFNSMVHDTGARVTKFSAEIANEAASLVTPYGSGDLGDCVLLATAHMLNLTLVTRDRRILQFAGNNSTYLSTVSC